MIILSSTVFLWVTCFFHSHFAIRIKVQQGVLDGGFPHVEGNEMTLYAYFGIPYAKPPVGELRFEAPQEPLSWQGVRNATDLPPSCIQKKIRLLRYDKYNLTIGQEDCLYLNVFTPNDGSVEEASSSHLLPVVVYIHGGAFQYGSVNNNRFEYLFKDHNNVVFVSFNFRLAVFGFLSAGDKILPGNMGLKDQVAALRWIQKNIAAFGGDPKRVTIIGSGSGATSVHLHMYSPLSMGLFHRAISTVGTALHMGTMVPTRIARGRARDLGKKFGCEPETEKLVKCLKKVPAEDIIAWLPNVVDLEIEIVSHPFAVVVEEENEGAFLAKNPWRYDAPINRVPWIVGINADEGCIPVCRLQYFKLLDKFFQDYERTFPNMFFYRHFVSVEDASNISDILKNFYFNDSYIDSAKDIEKMITLYTDANHAMSAMLAVERFNRNKTMMDNTAPVYLYLMDHQNHSLVENSGECLNDDMADFVLFREFFHPSITDFLDIIAAERLVGYAVNFINDGDPNGRVISEEEENTSSNQSLDFETNVQRKIWSPVRSSNFEYLHVKKNDSGVMEENLFNERYKFWKNNIFPFFESNP